MAYRDLKHELLAVVCGLEGVEDRGQLVSEELDCREKVSILSVGDSQSSTLVRKVCTDHLRRHQ